MNNRKKIAFIENHELGVYSIRKELVEALAKNHEVVILTEVDNSFKDESLEGPIEFVNIGKSVLNPFSAIKYNSKLYSSLRRLRPDVCLTFTIRPAIYGNITTRLLGIPTISTITGTGPLFESKSLSYRIARLMYRIVLKKTKIVVFPNYDDLNAFIDSGYIRKDQGRRFPGSGVNHEKFVPLPYREEDGKFKFLFISRLVKDKGVLEYVEAAKLLKDEFPNAEFHIIGPLWEGNKSSLTVTRKELDTWISNEWIIYHDRQKNVKPFISNSDCIVMPSYREGMSNVLLEASSMARPVIATDVTGCRDIVDDGITGFLCKPRDPIDLAEKMKLMMRLSITQREEMGAEGRKKVIREFDKKTVISLYLQAIEEVINGK